MDWWEDGQRNDNIAPYNGDFCLLAFTVPFGLIIPDPSLNKLRSQWDKLSFLFFKQRYDEVTSRIIRAKDDEIFCKAYEK